MKQTWLRTLGILFICGSALVAHADDAPFVKLTSPNLNQFFQTLFAPVLESQPKWISRLDLNFTKFDLDRSQIAFNGALAVNYSIWSSKASQLDFIVDYASPENRFNSNRNDTEIKLHLTLATEILPLAHFAAGRFHHRSCESKGEESEQDAAYRQANCAFAERLAKTDKVSDLADAFMDSVADLTAQLTDVERGMLATWEITPTISGPNQFRLVAKASGDPALSGTIEIAVKEDKIEVVSALKLAQTDAGKNQTLGVLTTYLGGFLEANPAQVARLQKALIEYAKTQAPTPGK